MLQERRKAKGWSQRELARRAKVTQGYVAQLESGLKANPSLPTLRKLAKALGVPVSQLVD